MKISIKTSLLALLLFSSINCTLKLKENKTYSEVKVIGAMKNVMWKGELDSNLDLDTITDKNELYGIGPEAYLKGELLINNGKSYVSKVSSDSTMTVEKRFNVSAPFFVYANVNDWVEEELTPSIRNYQDLERHINQKMNDFKKPFAFKLIGQISNASIHVQNLPKGTKVSSPDQAHIGQTNYELHNETVEIVGFFSREHKGVFTHHDSFLHMHLITADEKKMGHLDKLEIETMKLFLPRN